MLDHGIFDYGRSGSLSSIENENDVRTFVRVEIILILLDSTQFCIL